MTHVDLTEWVQEGDHVLEARAENLPGGVLAGDKLVVRENAAGKDGALVVVLLADGNASVQRLPVTDPQIRVMGVVVGLLRAFEVEA